MSPFEHGEVFVLDDGGEVWLLAQNHLHQHAHSELAQDFVAVSFHCSFRCSLLHPPELRV